MLAGFASPSSQTTASGSTSQSFAARRRHSPITSRTELMIARPLAKVTRLPPVTKLKPIDAVSAMIGRTLS